MDPIFLSYVEQLDAKVDALIRAPAHTYDTLPRGICRSGIYLFSDDERPLYVGRSNRIRGRLGSHCRDSSRHNAASFAFRLARERTGRTAASYTTAESRESLSNDPVFAAAFREAKAYRRSRRIQYVREEHQVTQALLEIYAAVRLKTPYNDFATH